MIILFPADTLSSPVVADFSFEREMEAAKAAGCKTALVDFEMYSNGASEPTARILGGKSDYKGEPAIYRGWMMNLEEYKDFYDLVLGSGYKLINSPEQYQYAHEFPQWYPDYETLTPKSLVFDNWEVRDKTIWVSENDKMKSISEVIIKKLGGLKYIVKDYVKSRKHDWDTACFIKDHKSIDEVVYNFVKLQDEDLYGGIVIRKYHEFKRVGDHAISKIPLLNESRHWFLNGEEIACHAYWSPAEGGDKIKLPDKLPMNIGNVFKSNFFTMDLAQDNILDNKYLVIEFGDGQVSGLPEHVDFKEFYSKIVKSF